MIQAVYPINVRLTKAQGEALQQAAELSGLSVSVLIRQAVEQVYVLPEKGEGQGQEAKS